MAMGCGNICLGKKKRKKKKKTTKVHFLKSWTVVQNLEWWTELNWTFSTPFRVCEASHYTCYELRCGLFVHKSSTFGDKSSWNAFSGCLTNSMLTNHYCKWHSHESLVASTHLYNKTILSGIISIVFNLRDEFLKCLVLLTTMKSCDVPFWAWRGQWIMI